MGPRSLSQGSLLWVESDQTKYCTEVLKRPISLKFYRNFTSVIDNAIITSKEVAMSSCSAQERKLIVFRRQRPLWPPFLFVLRQPRTKARVERRPQNPRQPAPREN